MSDSPPPPPPPPRYHDRPQQPPLSFGSVWERVEYFAKLAGPIRLKLSDDSDSNTDLITDASRQGFGRNSKNGQPGRATQPLPSPTGSGASSSANLTPLPQSPGPIGGMSIEVDATGDQPPQTQQVQQAQQVQQPQQLQQPQPQPQRKPPYFFRDEYSDLIVKGNFMTLSATPAYVDQGEWLAHQVVEQYRLLDSMIRIIKTHNDKTGQPICNPTSCPTMSAAGHTYTWLDQQKRPIKIPACQYILLVQKWIEGKFDDRNLFPIENPPVPGNGFSTSSNASASASGDTGPTTTTLVTPGKDWVGKASGFPENFETDVRSIYRQMMRCYAHLYHGHWLEPFWDHSATAHLNTCFLHFINVGRFFSILGEREMEPMLPLIQIWEAKGLLEPSTTQPQPLALPANEAGDKMQLSSPTTTTPGGTVA